MRFLARFGAWATVLFVPAWWIATPYQHALAAVAGALVVPRGSEIEWMALQLFYPFDVGIFLALVLASRWASWGRRARAAALGSGVMVAVELLGLAAAIVILLRTQGDTSAAATESAQRLANGIIRVTGLVVAGAVWFCFLGREPLSLAERRWRGEG